MINAAKNATKQETKPEAKTVEESLENPMEQERMRQTILDSLENEGIWAKDAEMKKEIANELLKQT